MEKLQLEKKRHFLEDTLDKYMYSVFDDIIDRYKELGYNVYDKILMCSNYGGFTNRRRLIIVAVRNDLISNSQKEKIIWKWPKITNSDDIKDNLPKPMVHVDGVLTPHLPKLNTVKDAFDLLDYNNINNPKTDLDNVPMKHKQTTIEKFKLITNEKKSDGYSSRGSSNRLSFDKPAPTLVPGHSSFQIHPSEHRSISVREGAIITGFPSTYKFVGSHSDRCVQIGNAIPIHLSNVLAKSCIELLSQL